MSIQDSPVSGPYFEPSREGGARYYRCDECGAESVFGVDGILHKSECSQEGRR